MCEKPLMWTSTCFIMYCFLGLFFPHPRHDQLCPVFSIRASTAWLNCWFFSLNLNTTTPDGDLVGLFWTSGTIWFAVSWEISFRKPEVFESLTLSFTVCHAYGGTEWPVRPHDMIYCHKSFFYSHITEWMEIIEKRGWNYGHLCLLGPCKGHNYSCRDDCQNIEFTLTNA